MPTTRRRLLAASGAVPLAGLAAGPAAAQSRRGRSRAYQLGAQTGIEALTLITRPMPQPGPGQALIAVTAAALNHRDLSLTRKRYGGPKPETRIPLGDGAGEVIAVGAGVTAVAVGDRVTAPHFTPWLEGAYSRSAFDADLGNTADGWLAEHVVLPAAALVKIPDGITTEAAAAIPAAGVTVWKVLHVFGGIKAGDTVLTLGTGGVAVAALQIAKMCGARVAITSSSDAKLARARELGADITVNYKTEPAWEKAILSATGGRGVDIVVETVGLATLPQSLACCAENARVGMVGALAQAQALPAAALSPMTFKNITVKGITSGSRRMLADLLTAMAANNVQPVIDKTFSFAQAKEAYAYLESAEHFGKVLITM